MIDEPRKILQTLLKAGLGAVDGSAAVRGALTLDGTLLHLTSPVTGAHQTFDLSEFLRIFVVGAGKAACAMACGLEQVLGDRITQGMVTTRYGHGADHRPTAIRVIEAGHPTPDAQGMQGASEASALLQAAGEHDLVIVLLSGGGSALWTLPEEGVSLDEVVRTTELLLASGAPIEAINAVRARISKLAGGGAARLAAPATVLVLAISDVVDDSLDVIASGPFKYSDILALPPRAVLERYNLQARLPSSVLSKVIADAPPPPSSQTSITHCICANNMVARRAICEKSRQEGIAVVAIDDPVTGEASEAAYTLCRIVEQKRREFAHRVPWCLVAGGETTVTLSTVAGQGGRNQELALAAALALQGQDRIWFLSCGTDGTDGTTDAAGAIVSGMTVPLARKRGLDARQYLRRHDSYGFFIQSGLDCLVRTGPTGTNVVDIQLILVV